MERVGKSLLYLYGVFVVEGHAAVLPLSASGESISGPTVHTCSCTKPRVAETSHYYENIKKSVSEFTSVLHTSMSENEQIYHL